MKTSLTSLTSLIWGCGRGAQLEMSIFPGWSWWPSWQHGMLMTGHGKTGAGGEEGDDAALPVELNWLSWELGPVSSILSKSQSSPVIKMKSIISLKFSWEIFWKLSVKENDKTNVIFMPSFTHNRWLAGSLTVPGLQNIPRYQDEINWEIFWEAQRQSKWYGKCYLYVIIYQQPAPVSRWCQAVFPCCWQPGRGPKDIKS